MKLPGLPIVCIALAVSGCASLPETQFAQRVQPGEAAALEPDEILVFGRLLFTVNGKRGVPYGLDKPLWQLESPAPLPGPEHVAGKRRILPFLRTDADGRFAYVIPAGRYAIAHAEPLGYQPLLDPGLEFEARAPGRAYYLGDVEVDFDARSWLGGLWGNAITRITRVEVVDRFDAARDALALQQPGHPAHIGKALLAPIPAHVPQLIERFVPPVIHR